MSNHLTSEVYKRRVGSMSRNAVLVLLADKASDDGSGIWASKQRMADELGCSKQTVIDTIKGLISDGLLIECGHRANPNGYTVEYAIDVKALHALPLVPHHDNQSSRLTGQKSGPVSEVDVTSQAAGPHQSSSLTQTPLNLPKPPSGARAKARTAAADLNNRIEGEARASAAPADGAADAGPELKGRLADRGTRLPADWTPPPIAELPPMARALVEQWPSGAYEAVCETFRLHWHSETRAVGCKRDWGAALGKWLINDHSKIMRDAKAGVSFAHLAPARQAAGTRPAPRPVAAKAREDERSAALHAALRQELGQQLYQTWIEGTALIHDAPGVLVIVASEFQRAWIEDRFQQQVQAAARAVMGSGVRWVRFQVERQTEGQARS